MGISLMRITVQFYWREIGAVGLEDGNLRFPKAPERPGIYRFRIGETVYIGQTDLLPRRFQHYRTPGPSQYTNIRIKARMIDQLMEGAAINVDVITEAEVMTDDNYCPLDFAKKHARLLVESAALTSTLLNGGVAENL